MTETDSPIRAMFDAQRSAIEGSQQLFAQGLTGQHAADRLTRTALRGQEALQRQQLEIAQAAAHGSVAAMTAIVPGDQRAAGQGVEESFERLKTAHEEFYDAMARELERDVDSGEGVEELLERQTRQMDSLQQQLEEQAAQIREQTRDPEQGELNIQVDVEHALEAIDGIGETTRERLVGAGISTVDDLTDSDPETVADAAEVSTSRARDWIEQAEA